jgi:hypothetical protein
LNFFSKNTKRNPRNNPLAGIFNRNGGSMHNVEQKRPVKNLPKTVDEAVKRLISDLPLKDKPLLPTWLKMI